MEPLWDIKYSIEARNYLYDSYPYTEDILIEIEKLRFTEAAIPIAGCTQIEPHVYMWTTLRHMVVYRRMPDIDPRPALWIAIVKPVD